MSVVHQLVPTFREGDATSAAAVDYRNALEDAGRAGLIYALDASFNERVRPVSELAPRPQDWVLYHHGIASELSGMLLRLPCRRGVVFHNISPERFFEGTQLFHALRTGRAQFAAMAPFVELGLGDSGFNAREMSEAGYRNVAVVPLCVDPALFREELADPGLLASLRARSPVLLAVSRVLPHKRMEDVLALHAEVLALRPQARLVIAGGYDEGSSYFRALRRTADGLPNVEFLGRVTHAQLVACYRGASVFVSMSEHEGFGVPPVEAMCSDIPVLAYAAAAVPETLAGHGVLFDRKDFALLAEMAVELTESAALRKAVLRGQQKRVAQLSPSNLAAHLMAAFAKAERPSQRKLA